MSTAASAPPVPLDPPTLRRELSEHHAYEMTLVPGTGVTLHLFETLAAAGHDAAVFLSTERIVELRDSLGTALAQLQPMMTLGGVRSPEAQLLGEQLRQIFVALIEHDKKSPSEVDALCSVIVQHLRSWRPIVLLASAPGGTVMP